MAETAADRTRFEAEGRTGSVKVKMPREGVCRFHDHVRGDVEVQWAGEQDIVIQRSDGTVTYNLANVVDDFDMKITHVIRAEEHLSNTPRQIFMLEGLGYPRPEYAHVPFVAEPGSKNKLSKRKIPQYLKNADFKKVYDHAKAIADRIGVATAPESFNPVLVDFYKQVGYLPAALLNSLVLLGWALDGQPRGLHPRADDRTVLAGARGQGPGEPRREEAVRVPGAVHAGAADRGEGRDGAAVPRARGARDRRGRGAAVRHARGGGRRAAHDRRRRHPRIRLPVPAGRPDRLRPGGRDEARRRRVQGRGERSAARRCADEAAGGGRGRGAVHPRHAEGRDGGAGRRPKARRPGR